MNTWIAGKDLMKHYQIKRSFYSELNLKDNTDKDCAHAQKVFKESKLKNLGDYHNLYVQSNTLLLADVFEKLETSVLKYMNLNLSFFFWTWISMATFKKTCLK